MKMILYSLLSLLALTAGNAAAPTKVDEIIRRIPITSPATSNRNQQTVHSIYLAPEFRKFPDYVCQDFQRTQPLAPIDPNKREFCNAYYQFRKPGNDSYTVLGVGVGQSDEWKALLITYDFQGNQIDWVEVEVKFGDIALKQYQITPEMKLYIYELKPTSTTPLYYYEDYILKGANSLPAQRIDAVYQIGDDGKITKLSEKKYKPQTYQLTALEGATISAGKEVPLP